MNTCKNCGGAIQPPGTVWGYVGPMCQCQWKPQLPDEQYKALQTHANTLAEENRMLLLRIDQLKWENDKLKDEVEMLSIDLGVKNESLHTK